MSILWDESSPDGAVDPGSVVDNEFRALRRSIRQMWEREHGAPTEESIPRSTGHGVHQRGSARLGLDTQANILALSPDSEDARIYFAQDTGRLLIGDADAGPAAWRDIQRLGPDDPGELDIFRFGGVVDFVNTVLLDGVVADFKRTGDLRFSAKSFAGGEPPGWLLCNGQAVSRATFADLFATIDISYGPGDTVTTFNLPDYQDRVFVGASSWQVSGPGGRPNSEPGSTGPAGQGGSATHDHGGANVTSVGSATIGITGSVLDRIDGAHTHDFIVSADQNIGYWIALAVLIKT